MTGLQDSELNLRSIQQYESDESEADDQESLPNKQKKNWIIAETFENANQVTEWLKENTTWSYKRPYETKAGTKIGKIGTETRNRGKPIKTRKALEMQPDDRLTTVLSITTSQKRLASPIESVNKRNRITENVDEILEEQDGTRQTRSKANNLIKSTAQSSSHSATQEVKRQRGRPKKTAV